MSLGWAGAREFYDLEVWMGGELGGLTSQWLSGRVEDGNQDMDPAGPRTG